MEKFISVYEKINLEGYIDDHRFKALRVLYTLAKMCQTKKTQPCQPLNGKEAVCAKVALYAAGGLRIEKMLPWQESIKEICQSAIEKLSEKGVFTKKEGFAYLIEPLVKKEFSVEYLEMIFDEIANITKGKLSEIFSRQMMQSD